MKYAIKATIMRGGVAKGAFFNRNDLPHDAKERDRFLLSAFATPLNSQNDGIGGGTLTSNRIAIIEKSTDKADINFLFGQVLPDENRIDYTSNCGNMLAAAGPFAIEAGIITPLIRDGEIKLTINNINTNSLVDSRFYIHNGIVQYVGNVSLDGITRNYSPIELDFGNAIGLTTGRLFPSGREIDKICGINVTCIDAAMPVVVINAQDVGLSGYESKKQIDDNESLRKQLFDIRVIAGELMGFGDVKEKSIPKICIFANPCQGGTVSARYIDPTFCHPQFGITAGLALATAARVTGTNICNHLNLSENIDDFIIEHPSGILPLAINVAEKNGSIFLKKAANITTAKKIMDGTLYAE